MRHESFAAVGVFPSEAGGLPKYRWSATSLPGEGSRGPASYARAAAEERTLVGSGPRECFVGPVLGGYPQFERHRRDVEVTQVVAAEGDAGGAGDGHLHDAVERACRRVATH